MQRQTFLLLLWTLTAFVSCQDSKTDSEIVVKTVSDGIVLSCGKNKIKNKDGQEVESLKLEYKDENTGEYPCVSHDEDEDEDEEVEKEKIFVKFRRCENCIDLDLTSILGIVVGNVVATTVIGVAVYLIASQKRTSATTTPKSSDRQTLVPNEGRSRAPQLKHRSAQKDTYDVLANKK